MQKGALHVILGDQYDSHQSTLKRVSLEELESRRNKLCTKFEKKSEKMWKLAAHQGTN